MAQQPTSAGLPQHSEHTLPNGIKETRDRISNVDEVRLNFAAPAGSKEARAINNVVITDSKVASVSTHGGNDYIRLEYTRSQTNGRRYSVLGHAGEGDDWVALKSENAGVVGSLHGGKGDDTFIVDIPSMQSGRTGRLAIPHAGPSSDIVVNGDEGKFDLVSIANPEQFTFKKDSAGVYKLTAPNGSTITLVGVEYIQYEGSTMLHTAKLSELESPLAPSNLKAAIDRLPTDEYDRRSR